MFYRLLAILLISTGSLHAQKEWSNWYYNGKNLLSFKNGNPEIIQNFINPIPDWQTNFFHFYTWGAGGISYSDPVTGEMKFIISNRLGFDRNYKDFPNDNFVRSCPDKYSYHIIPFSGNKDKFYVVQFQSAAADLLAQESGLQVRCPNAIGLGYSIVDLTANGGMGDFTTINQQFAGGFSEQITLVKHANQKDVWVVTHQVGGNNFFAYLFTDAGVQPGIASPVGPAIPPRFQSTFGMMTAMHAGSTIAASSSTVSGVMLFDFDNATGKLSNYRTMKSSEGIGNLQFSPDDSKLYYSSGNGIYQYDFNQPDVEASLTKIYQDEITDLIYDMQLAPNGKIYFTKTYVFENGQYNEYTGSLECPNLPQYACNPNKKALNTVQVSFPDLVNDFIKDPKAPPVTRFTLGNDTAVCFGSLKITAPLGWESYQWNTGETTREITVTKAGTYYVLTGSTGFSCPSGYGFINVADKAIKLDLGKDSVICPGATYDLHINADYTNILWQNGSHVRDTVVTNQLYGIVSANDKHGCYTKDTISVGAKYYPRAIFGADTTLCNQQTLTLKLEPLSNVFFSGVYKWQDGSSLDSFKITAPGTYWGEVTYDGCTVSDTIHVSFINVQQLNLGRDTSLCEGDYLELKPAVVNASYHWNTGATSSSIVVNQSGQYILEATSNGCALSDTINVNFQPPPTFGLPQDTKICAGEGLLLDPGITGDHYLWQDGSTARNLVATQPGWYWLQLTTNGCTSSDSMYIDQYVAPLINFGNDQSLCRGDSLVLDAGPGFSSYNWNTGAGVSSIVVKNAGEYLVLAQTTDGCTVSDTMTVLNLYEHPVITLDPNENLCAGVARTLDAGNFQSYQWSTGATSRTITATTIGIYSVDVTDQYGCHGSGSTEIKNMAPVPAGFLTGDTVICQYGTLEIIPAGNYASYHWSTNATTRTIQINQPGVYWLQVQDHYDCEGTDTILVGSKDCMEGMYVPTAFTPNSDGKNDIFRPLLFGDIRQYRFTVYNRWGEKVFESSRPGEGWDGRRSGIALETSAFVWVCSYQLTGHEPETRRGTVMLVK
jgi:gliding motility-associated-like protein